MAVYIEKVTAFVTRPHPSGRQLLLFQHPYAGIQIPAGTVEEHEPLEQAVVRELAEETGLTGARIIQYLGKRDELPPGCTHIIAARTPVYARPDPTSFDWAAFHRGIPVRLLRRQPPFAQVTYEEGDRFPDPHYQTYVITGWVPETALAEANRRHFFHLEYTGDSPDRWRLPADKHIFEPFWAPLDHLPEIVPFQRKWLTFFRLP